MSTLEHKNTNHLIIVPVHPPHFHWATKLLDSASPLDNIALGFSNQKDADLFSHSFPYVTLLSNISDREAGFINKKKLDLLKKAHGNYSYLSIIDAETIFLRPTSNHLDKIWADNCFVANHSTDGARIMRELCKMCGYDYTDDLYPWFNSFPLYKSELLPGFFNWMQGRTAALSTLVGFDFLLFAIYCRYELNMPWRVLDGYAFHGLVENQTVWEKRKDLVHQVSWSTYYKDVDKNENILMLFHLDRYPMN